MNLYDKCGGSELKERYIELCLELGKDEEARDFPDNRDELIRRLKELNFQWLHEYHIG